MKQWTISPYRTMDAYDAYNDTFSFENYFDAFHVAKEYMRKTGVGWAIFGPRNDLECVVGPGLEWTE